MKNFVVFMRPVVARIENLYVISQSGCAPLWAFCIKKRIVVLPGRTKEIGPLTPGQFDQRFLLK